MKAIVVENLVKQFHNGVQALNGISLTVQEGEIFSLLGQNGAGKSTLINILTTYLSPTSGSIKMFGKSIDKNLPAVRSKIARVSQNTSLDTCLSLMENMMFQSRLYKIPKKEAKKRMDRLIDCFGLKSYCKYPVSSYSGGVKRRLDIAINMMSNPGILFMDEPTVGMDIQSRRAMWDIMKKIQKDFGTTIFLTTHYLEEADILSNTICIMKDGREIVRGTPNSLREYLQQDMLKIRFADKESAKQNLQRLSEIFPDRKSTVREENILIPVDDPLENLSRAGYFLFHKKIVFMGLEIMRPDIEDVFIRLIQDEEGCA